MVQQIISTNDQLQLLRCQLVTAVDLVVFHFGVSNLKGQGPPVTTSRSTDRSPASSNEKRGSAGRNGPKGGWLYDSTHGHGAKGDIEGHLAMRCSAGSCIMDITPVIPTNALRAAVEQNLVEKVSLIKHEPGSSNEFGDTSKRSTKASAPVSGDRGGGVLVYSSRDPEAAPTSLETAQPLRGSDVDRGKC